jgi:endothelin-converting enzyme
MDGITSGKALEKLNALGSKVGYPEYISDPAKLDKFYEKASIYLGTRIVT